MTYTIPNEYEQAIDQAVAAGAFASPEQAVRHAFNLLISEQTLEPDLDFVAKDHDLWMTELRAWSANHPAVEHVVHDRREDIYDGRGL